MARTIRAKRRRDETVSAGASEEESSAPATKKMKDLPKRSSTRSKKPVENPQEAMCTAAAAAADAAAAATTTDAESAFSDTGSSTSISIWIGASTQEDQTSGTIGVYYGEADDERNWTGRPELEKYNADDAYVWAATQAIERLDNDATRIVIYTECSTLGDAKEGDALREQLHARISQRSGTTQFQHALPSTSLKLQKAHELAKGATKKQTVEDREVDQPMQIDDGASDVDAEKAKDAAITMTADNASNASWKPAFGLRNIFEILKAPFVRGTRTV